MKKLPPVWITHGIAISEKTFYNNTNIKCSILRKVVEIIMLSREKYISEISTKLSWIKAKVEMCSSLNLLDCNIHMEYFLCGLLNIVYGYHLINLNAVQANYTSIDLGDPNEKLAIQVTSDNSSKKIKDTISKFVDNYYNLQFDRLIVLIIGNKKAYTADFSTDSGFAISKDNDVWDFTKVMNDISRKNTDELVEIATYFDRELINSNGYIGIIPCNIVDEMYRKARALCLSKLIATGLPSPLSEQIMANDIESSKYQYIMDALLQGKRYLVGGFGTGKSHTMLVLCQKLSHEYSLGHSDYIPLFTHVRDIVRVGSIEAWLSSKSVTNKKYILFLDGLDEVEYASAKQIIAEEQYLSIFSPENLILIGSRPLSYLPGDSYQIEIKALSTAQQEELINVIDSDENKRFLPRITPDQLKQSLSRPLFCIIFALLRNDGNIGWQTNEVDILSVFVERATKDIIESCRTAYYDLIALSVKAIDKDFSDIHISEVALSGTIDTILKTGLVSKHGNYLNFPLVIVAQFLAAKAIQQKIVEINSIIESKEKMGHWKYPLSIAFTQSTFDASFDLFAAIIRTSPGMASQIIRDGIRTEKTHSLQTARECGEMIVRCMNVWRESLGELGRYIVPIKGSSILTLGICITDAMISYTWFESKSKDPVVVISYQEMMRLHGTIYTRGISAQATWPWIVTLDDLSRNLKKRIDSKSILGSCLQLHQEAFWDAARIMAQKGSLSHDAISVNSFEQYRDIPRGILGFRERDIDLDVFFSVLDKYIDNGISEIAPPFPTRDREYSGLVWSCYSPERYLELTRFAFSSALKSYMELTETVFSCFKDSLSIAQLSPCKIVGGLEFDPESDINHCPGLDWYLQALPRGSNNEVDIEYRTIPHNNSSFLDMISQNIKKNRPELKYKGFIMRSECLRLNNPTPVTNVVYDWLDSELKDIGWIKLRNYAWK